MQGAEPTMSDATEGQGPSGDMFGDAIERIAGGVEQNPVEQSASEPNNMNSTKSLRRSPLTRRSTGPLTSVKLSQTFRQQSARWFWNATSNWNRCTAGRRKSWQSSRSNLPGGKHCKSA